MKYIITTFSVLAFCVSVCFAQDKIVYIEQPDDFQQSLECLIDENFSKTEPEEKLLKVDLSGYSLPEATEEFSQVWHFPPTSQDFTGTCWAFSSTSFFESEIHRLTGRKIRLSEMYTVYWEYIAKAMEFIETKGDSNFGRGSEANATLRIWKEHGIVPYNAYQCRKINACVFDHREMYRELREYLLSVKQQGEWDNEDALAYVREVLDWYMGRPPESVSVGGIEMTPQQYLSDYLRLNLDDYIDLLSLMNQPLHERVEYCVYDNWWHCENYYNVLLEEFEAIVDHAIEKRLSICISGDTSEPGYRQDRDVALIPTFDIPPESIDDEARVYRFEQGLTTDDHAIHLVGYLDRGDRRWYLIKDSGSSARNGSVDGYMFYSQDYILLKMMNILIHKEALGDIVSVE